MNNQPEYFSTKGLPSMHTFFSYMLLYYLYNKLSIAQKEQLNIFITHRLYDVYYYVKHYADVSARYYGLPNCDVKTIDDAILENDEEKENVVAKIVMKYDEKYMEKYKNLENVTLTKERLDSLKNSIIMENTPLGNVLMFYNHARETFVYYSDNTIPYRYLEVVGRKYVITNNCKSIFVDMLDVLKEAEQKVVLEKEQKEKEDLEEKEKEKEKEYLEKEPLEKANVFAKLKSYNQDSLKTSNISTTRPQSNPASTKKTDNKLVKTSANRYSYEGKMVNYSFLQKVNKNVVDKNSDLTFAEFKKMKQNDKTENIVK